MADNDSRGFRPPAVWHSTQTSTVSSAESAQSVENTTERDEPTATSPTLATATLSPYVYTMSGDHAGDTACHANTVAIPSMAIATLVVNVAANPSPNTIVGTLFLFALALMYS